MKETVKITLLNFGLELNFFMFIAFAKLLNSFNIANAFVIIRYTFKKISCIIFANANVFLGETIRKINKF